MAGKSTTLVQICGLPMIQAEGYFKVFFDAL
jgi:hypothetical protein